MRNLFLASLLVLTSFAGSASASLITGKIGFAGVLDVTPTSGDLSTATGIDFLSALILTTSGDLTTASTTAGTAVTFTDFDFSAAPIVPLWSVGGFSFDLSSVIVTQTVDTLNLIGSGILKHIGFDDTPGTFELSTQGTSANFTFSANTAAVPEPTALLVWCGLSMAGVLVRRRKS